MPKKIKEETLEVCPATPEDEALLAENISENTSVALPKGAYEKEIVGADGKKYIKVYSEDGSTISVTPVEEVKE
ncbi:MAG: hypothetical protein JSS91_00815 [Bacteroidetes bacterium]|nr:hypothetical protein [Bacteroidota bacterium]